MYLNGFFAIFGRGLCAVILACAYIGAVLPLSHAAEPLRVGVDLQATAKLAREQRAPILLAFTTSTCPYCAVARRDYLVPMQVSVQWRDKVVMREIVLDTSATLRDFNGEAVAIRDFARRYGVRSVPTVIVFDGKGSQVTQPLIGLSSSDFYGLYLEQAIEAGLLRMRKSKP
jgi:thioredoxin-related protein